MKKLLLSILLFTSFVSARDVPRDNQIQVQIKIYKIQNKGMKSFDTFHESTLESITLGQPRNGFERGILKAYDMCREEALERYFPYLDKRDIEVLLRDNYLQKKDLKRIFSNRRA